MPPIKMTLEADAILDDVELCRSASLSRLSVSVTIANRSDVPVPLLFVVVLKVESVADMLDAVVVR